MLVPKKNFSWCSAWVVIASWAVSPSGSGPQVCSLAYPPLGLLITLSSTARHKDPSKWMVQFGERSSRPPFWNLRALYHRYRVQDIIMYPNFGGSLLNDIALLRLFSSVTYNKYIQPICVLDSSSKFQNRTNCWVTGWGHIRENKGEAGDRQIGKREALSFFPNLTSPYLVCVQLSLSVGPLRLSPLLPSTPAPLRGQDF